MPDAPDKIDYRLCQGRCGKEMDRWDMEEVYDAQGIYVGLFCSRKCAEKKYLLNRTNQEAYSAGDWGDDGDY